MVTIGEKYVERAEKALVETVVLSELRAQSNLTMDQIVQRVKGVGTWDAKVDKDFVEGCVKRLDRDGHVKEENDKYAITDDGREDIMKLENIFTSVTSKIKTAGTPGTRPTGTTRTGGF